MKRYEFIILVVLLAVIAGILFFWSSGVAEISDDVKETIILKYGRMDCVKQDAWYRNCELEIVGAGEILPKERAEGADAVVCFKIRYMRNKDKSNYRNIEWEPAVLSGVTWRIGDQWLWNNRSYIFFNAESDWLQHSCPEPFEWGRGGYQIIVP